MRKIKKFKIPVYSHDVLRKARKHKLDLAGAGLGEEQAVKEYVSSLAAALEPAVVFEYLEPADEAAMKINGDAPRPLTAGILTLGPKFEEKLASSSDETHKALDSIAARVFLNTAVAVTAELALREAEPEGFEFEEPVFIFSCPEAEVPAPENTAVPLYESELVQSLCARLDAVKIGVNCDSGVLTPKYSALFALPWLSKKKKKSSAASKK